MRERDHFVFPAIFFKDEKYIGVKFPDFPGCNTFGENEIEALRMAKDALSGHLLCMEDVGEPFPAPTPFDEISLARGESVVIVEIWLSLLRDEERNKAVKKTITIPNWLNRRAVEAQVNFSWLMQEALRERLGV